MANLLVEIGNTALKAAWCENLTLGKTYRYQGEDTVKFILSIISREKPEYMAVASVRTLSAEEQGSLQAACTHLLLLDSEHSQLLAKYNLPDYITYDRAAAAVAVRGMFAGKNCTVFDFGTTLSVDVIDSSGAYVGGNVSLGCRTRFKALNRYSRSLPLVNTPEEVPSLGKSAQQAIEAGVISGIKFEIEGYAARYPGNVIVFTGGDANYFAKQMKIPIFVVCNLVLIGLAYIVNDYAEQSN